MAKLTNIRCEKLILNAADLPSNWHAAYAMTQRRRTSLLGEVSNSSSFFKATSETAMTVFMLGQFEGWGQAHLTVEHKAGSTPRDLDDGLNREFFQRFASPWASSTPRVSPLGGFLSDRLAIDPDTVADPFLLFELSTFSDAFNGGKAVQDPSFLKGNGESSCFDAITILPAARTLVFFESNLDVDGTHGARQHNVEQSIRHLEAAFFLTTLPESQYCGWDFRYVLLCPKNSTKTGKEFERFFTDGNNSHLDEYELRLADPENLQNLCPSRAAYRLQWDTLRSRLSQHLSVIYWSDIMAELVELGFDPQNYLRNLAAIDRHDNRLVPATKRRWTTAGIELS
jgi:hypothetical protein